MWTRRWCILHLRTKATIIIGYSSISMVLLVAMYQTPPMTFVADHLRVRSPLMFLAAAGAPFSDEEAAGAFVHRRCGSCFITNNKGFLPIAEYDAVLVHGKRDLLSETVAFMDPGKRYLIEASEECVRNKLRCREEPRVTSFSSREVLTLCSLCDKLIHEQQKHSYPSTLYLEDAYAVW